MDVAFLASTHLLIRRHVQPFLPVKALRTGHKSIQSTPRFTATSRPRPLRNLIILATAAVTLRLPTPAAASARTVQPVATLTRAFPINGRVSSSTAIRTRSVATAPAPITIADRIGFWAGEFLMWNPAAKVIALLACTMLAMYLGSFLYRLADPERAEAKYPFWHAVRAVANPLEDDWEKNTLRSTSIALAAVGMVVFAILVGMVTESVESAVQNVDGDMSRVVVSDHILVCGWSPHVSQILKDVNNVANRVKVVVLASPENKQRMIDHMRDVLSEEERGQLRLYYRSGAPIVQEDLYRVGASRAKKIILVNSQGGDSVDADRRILSRALALRQNLPGFSGDIVAEINSVRDEGILKSILGSTAARSVETVNAEQLLFRFMAQAIRQPGLADVVANLMGDDPTSVFHVKKAREVAPQLIGVNYADILPTSIPGSVLCGFFDSGGKVSIGTGRSMLAKGEGSKLQADTDLLLLGSKNGTKKAEKFTVSRTTKSRMDALYGNAERAGKRGAETYLVCGWRQDMQDMLSELDSILPAGSKITILDEDTPDSLPGFKNLTVSCIKKRPDRYENLEELLHHKAKPYDHVVLLGSAYGDESDTVVQRGQEQDTKTLASLVYVNELLSKQYDTNFAKKPNTKPSIVTVEFINERVAGMAKEQGNVANAILPQNLSAKIAAQTVRDNRLNCVWKELLSQWGREVYMRPCVAYAETSEQNYSFAALSNTLAKTTDDILIGYVRQDGRVIINPQGTEKFNSREWDKRDMLIVLSEE